MKFDEIKGLAASKTLINLSIASPKVIICLVKMLSMTTKELEREVECAFYADPKLFQMHEACLDLDENEVFEETKRGKLKLEDEDICTDILVSAYKNIAGDKACISGKDYTVGDVKRAIAFIYEKMDYDLDSRSQGNLVKVLMKNINDEEREKSIIAMHDLIVNDFSNPDFVLELSKLK